MIIHTEKAHFWLTLETLVKSTLKIPPRHNGIIPITIKWHNLKASMGYFISNQHTNKGLDPKIHVIDGIYNIKGRSNLHILVANYTNKHVTLNKGLCIGHIEQFVEHMPWTSINSVTTQKMIDEHVQSDTFTPPLHNLMSNMRKSLNSLLETFKSKLVKDETGIGTTHSKNAKWHRQLLTCLSTAMSHHHEALLQCKKWNKQTPWYTCNSQKLFQMVSTYHCITQGQWQKMPSHWLQGSEQSHTEICVDISKLNGAKYFSTLDLCTGYHHIPLNEDPIPKTAFTSPFGKYEYLKVPFELAQVPAYFEELMNKLPRDLPFTIAYLDDVII